MALSRFGPPCGLANQKSSPFQGGAAYVDGRAGFPVPADPDRQNWESGIDLTVRSCTFFRNWGPFAAALWLEDVWPVKALYEDVDFVQNHASLMHANEMALMFPYPGSERRVGFSSVLYKSCHWDGGYESEGLSGVTPGSQPWIDADTNDHPAAVTNVTFDGATFVDHGAVLWGIILNLEIWPPQSDQLRQANLRVLDLDMSDCKSLLPGDEFDGTYFFFTGTRAVTERSRFSTNGIFDPAARGTGNGPMWGESAHPDNRPSARFVNTEWVVRARKQRIWNTSLRS